LGPCIFRVLPGGQGLWQKGGGSGAAPSVGPRKSFRGEAATKIGGFKTKNESGVEGRVATRFISL